MNYVEWNNLYENTEKLLHDVFDALYFQILLDTDGRIVYINQIYADFFRHEEAGHYRHENRRTHSKYKTL